MGSIGGLPINYIWKQCIYDVSLCIVGAISGIDSDTNRAIAVSNN